MQFKKKQLGNISFYFEKKIMQANSYRALDIIEQWSWESSIRYDLKYLTPYTG